LDNNNKTAAHPELRSTASLVKKRLEKRYLQLIQHTTIMKHAVFTWIIHCVVVQIFRYKKANGLDCLLILKSNFMPRSGT
jgi:hypothetical protein